MSYSNLVNFYEMEFNLKVDHGYSLEEQYMMAPYERDMVVDRIIQRLKKIKEAREVNDR